MKAVSPNNTGTLEKPGPIYHDTSEEQKRAQAYIIAGYVPFGHHLEKAKETSFRSNSPEFSDLPNLQDLYLSSTELDTSLEFEDEFPYYSDEQDPYRFEKILLPDLISDLNSIKREKRDYTGRIEHTIKLHKKEKVYTEGRLNPIESYQTESSNFPTKRDPKATIGKMASSIHTGGIGANDKSAADGSQQGSNASMTQSTAHSHFKISDLIHPTLNNPLKTQQQVTFRLVKTGTVN